MESVYPLDRFHLFIRHTLERVPHMNAFDDENLAIFLDLTGRVRDQVPV